MFSAHSETLYSRVSSSRTANGLVSETGEVAVRALAASGALRWKELASFGKRESREESPARTNTTKER